jgi:hypothetical protein
MQREQNKLEAEKKERSERMERSEREKQGEWKGSDKHLNDRKESDRHLSESQLGERQLGDRKESDRHLNERLPGDRKESDRKESERTVKERKEWMRTEGDGRGQESETKEWGKSNLERKEGYSQKECDQKECDRKEKMGMNKLGGKECSSCESSNCQVQVKNISTSATEKNLRDFFSYCGNITSLKLTPCTCDHGATNTAIITFSNLAAVQTSLLLSHAMIVDKPITVEVLGDSSASKRYVEPEGGASKSSIVAKMVASGYKLGDDAKTKAKTFDESHTSALKKNAGKDRNEKDLKGGNAGNHSSATSTTTHTTTTNKTTASATANNTRPAPAFTTNSHTPFVK